MSHRPVHCSNEVLQVRAALVHKSFDEWCDTLRRYPLHYLHSQISSLDYNEALPYPDLNMRPALYKVMEEKKSNGERLRKSKAPTTIIHSSDETVTYERHKYGGKGQTILVSV